MPYVKCPSGILVSHTATQHEPEKWGGLGGTKSPLTHDGRITG